MRKEVIFAIIAGVFFGLVVAFGVWRANTALNNTEVNKTASSETSPTQAPQQRNLSLAISNPESNDVMVETPTTITGITSPNSWVVISGEEEDYIINSGNKGEFEQEVDLVGGLNQIIITSFKEDGTSISSGLDLVFSTEFAEQIEGSEE